jgi:hypothetical protein
LGGVRTTHPDFGIVTDAAEAGGKLWMGTIGFPAVAYCAIA